MKLHQRYIKVVDVLIYCNWRGLCGLDARVIPFKIPLIRRKLADTFLQNWGNNSQVSLALKRASLVKSVLQLSSYI